MYAFLTHDTVFIFLFIVESERLKFVQSRCGVTHKINRYNIFDDVIELLKKSDVVEEFPFRVSFSGEEAIDTGGVTRDMLSAFWEEAFTQLFDGQSLVVPVVHAHTDLSFYQILEGFYHMVILIVGFYLLE